MIKRKVLYIPGFDPRSEAFYKKLLFKQFPEIKRHLVKNDKSEFSYAVDGMHLDYEILSWHESVKAYWSTGLLGNLVNVKTTFSDYVFKGTWGRLFRLSRRDGMQKAFSPYFFFAWFLFLIFGIGYLVSGFLEGRELTKNLALLLLFILTNVGAYYFLDRLNLFWVNRIMAFFVRYSKQEAPLVIEDELRIKQKVLSDLESNEYDEVVLVAHSVGSILCLSVMAELAEEGLAQDLTVITLGHCVSGVSILPESEWFNAKLKQVKKRKFNWVDVTSGKDAVTFYKVTPAYHSDILPDLTLSAGFHEIFTASFYQKMKWNFYEIHFLYLYHPSFPEKGLFNYQKLLFCPTLIQDIERVTKGKS